MRIIQLQGSRVLLDVDRSPHRFAGGQLELVKLPDKDGDYITEPIRGQIVMCGPDVQDLDVGDHVILDNYHGVELPTIEFDGRQCRDLVIVKEAFVMLVVEDESSEMGVL